MVDLFGKLAKHFYENYYTSPTWDELPVETRAEFILELKVYLAECEQKFRVSIFDREPLYSGFA